VGPPGLPAPHNGTGDSRAAREIRAELLQGRREPELVQHPRPKVRCDTLNLADRPLAEIDHAFDSLAEGGGRFGETLFQPVEIHLERGKLLADLVTTQEGSRGGTPPEGSWRVWLALPVG
jgi:hypothetical protein